MNFFDSFFKKDNDREMKFSLEIGPQTDLETVPKVGDVYISWSVIQNNLRPFESSALSSISTEDSKYIYKKTL